MKKTNIISDRLHQQVPLSKHLGVNVSDYRDYAVTVEAPLEPNINSHGTAFAGSLYSVAAVTGVSLINLSLMDHGIEPSVLLVRAEVTYVKPVAHDIKASAVVEESTFKAFLGALKNKGKSRIDINIEVESDGEAAMTLAAHFAVLDKNRS